MSGILRLYCGPMFAGKTTALMNEAHGRFVILKPAMDTRYGMENISSHDGIRVPALPIRSKPTDLPEGVEKVLIDEVQFLESPWFDDEITIFVRELLVKGVHVVAAGLDMDAHGHPFEVTAHLAAMADEVIKLRATCVECGAPAVMTRRKGLGSERVSLGGSESYEAVCRLHHEFTERK